MLDYTIRPISDRTMFTGRHRRSMFDTAWSKTERTLLVEIGHLNGRDVIIEVDVTELEIRNDGRIRANARPSTPGVRVAFTSKHGPLTYATDQFNHWQDNVRAIALGLMALRAVDRYGITKNAEQYAGYKAIGAGSGGQAMGAQPAMTVADAWAIIGSFGERPISEQRQDPSKAASAYRKARAFAHPDRQAGDRDLWDQVEQAAKVLGLT